MKSELMENSLAEVLEIISATVNESLEQEGERRDIEITYRPIKTPRLAGRVTVCLCGIEILDTWIQRGES